MTEETDQRQVIKRSRDDETETGDYPSKMPQISDDIQEQDKNMLNRWKALYGCTSSTLWPQMREKIEEVQRKDGFKPLYLVWLRDFARNIPPMAFAIYPDRGEADKHLQDILKEEAENRPNSYEEPDYGIQEILVSPEFYQEHRDSKQLFCVVFLTCHDTMYSKQWQDQNPGEEGLSEVLYVGESCGLNEVDELELVKDLALNFAKREFLLRKTEYNGMKEDLQTIQNMDDLRDYFGDYGYMFISYDDCCIEPSYISAEMIDAELEGLKEERESDKENLKAEIRDLLPNHSPEAGTDVTVYKRHEKNPNIIRKIRVAYH